MKPETETKRELWKLRKEYDEVKKSAPRDWERLESIRDKMALKALVYLTVNLDANSAECDIANLGLHGFDRS